MKLADNNSVEWLRFSPSNPGKYGWEKYEMKYNGFIHRKNKTLAWIEGREVVFKHITKGFSVQNTLTEAASEYHRLMVFNDCYPKE